MNHFDLHLEPAQETKEFWATNIRISSLAACVWIHRIVFGFFFSMHGFWIWPVVEFSQQKPPAPVDPMLPH